MHHRRMVPGCHSRATPGLVSLSHGTCPYLKHDPSLSKIEAEGTRCHKEISRRRRSKGIQVPRLEKPDRTWVTDSAAKLPYQHMQGQKGRPEKR